MDFLKLDTTSKPSNPLRYRYIILMITWIVIIFIVNKRAKLLDVNKIKIKGLIAYLGFIIFGFWAVMSFQTTNLGASDANWATMHFIFYFFLAYFVPNNYLLIGILQISWELFEDFMGYNIGHSDWIESDKKKLMDVTANTLGYYFGNLAFNTTTYSDIKPQLRMGGSMI